MLSLYATVCSVAIMAYNLKNQNTLNYYINNTFILVTQMILFVRAAFTILEKYFNTQKIQTSLV